MFWHKVYLDNGKVGIMRAGQIVYEAFCTPREDFKVDQTVAWFNDCIFRAQWIDADLMYTTMLRAA